VAAPSPVHRPHNATATIAKAKQLAWLADRPNTFIKIPATMAGLSAIFEVIGKGTSVNVTLIFSPWSGTGR
jgi:transaldolase